MKFGKHAKRNDRYYRTLQIADYLPSSVGIPLAPMASANLARMYSALKDSNPAELLPMDGNDFVGDCTMAALAHAITMIAAFAGNGKIVPSKQEVLSLYFELTGGQDTGLDMLTVCNFIRQQGWLGEKPILAFAEVDLRNKYLMRQCIALFGFVYTGFQVPRKCIEQFNAGGPWTAGPLTNEGHCVNLVDYDTRTGLLVPETWGNVTTATWPWEQECVDEAYVLIPAEAATPGYIPGFDVQQLLADLKEVTR